MRNLKNAILVFLLGTAAALLLLELSLRILGVISRGGLLSSTQHGSPRDNKPYTILCLGNSFTVGFGAPNGKGYPEQLQVLLDKAFPGKKITVVNAGAGNQNSAELLSSLHCNIMKWSPDLVIIQTGQPNFWNQYKYAEYLRREHAPDIFFKRRSLYLNDLFYYSRVYRLILLLCDGIKERWRASRLDSTWDDPRQAEIRSWLIKLEQDYYMDQPHFKMNIEDAVKAAAVFKEGIILRPADVNNYRYLGEIALFQKQYREAAQWFIRGIQADPGYRGDEEENRNFFFLKLVYGTCGDTELKQRIDGFIDSFKRAHPREADSFLFLTDAEIYRWVDSDIREACRIIRSERIRLILQNFPPIANMAEGRKACYFNSVILPGIARELHIAFVDNNLVFQKLLYQGEDRDGFFVSDGHCSAKGYGIMARNVYDKIREEKCVR